MNQVLKICNLTIGLSSLKEESSKTILKDVSLNIFQGETVVLLGNSGSGKSTLGQSIVSLLPRPFFAKKSGTIFLKDEKTHKLLEVCDPKKVRGKEIGYIFQEPLSALNPIQTVGEQLLECFEYHQDYIDLSNAEKKEKIFAIFTKVQLNNTELIFNSFPHQLSGGMRQRVLIAMSILLSPKLLIADEPTSSLDANTEQQVITLIKQLQRDLQMSLLFITHNISIALQIADRVCVIEKGVITEDTPIDIFSQSPTSLAGKSLLSSFLQLKTGKLL